MKRREFIVSSISLMLSTAVFATPNKKKSFNIYIDESGNIGTLRPLVIGALLIESDYDFDRILAIRKKSGFKLILKYSSSNEYKTRLSEPLLKEFFDSNKMRFSAIAFPENINKAWPSRKSHRSVLYHNNYSNLLKNNDLSGIELNIYLKYRSLWGEDEFRLKSFLEKKFKNVKISFIRDIQSDCIQLADLLTGSIYGEMNRVHGKTKISVINNLKSAIKENNLSSSVNYQKGKFKLDVRTKL